MKKWRSFILLAVVALAAQPLAGPAGADEETGTSVTESLPITAAPGTVVPEEVRPVRGDPVTNQDCATVMGDLAQLAASGATAAVCVGERQDVVAPMAPYPNPQHECAFDGMLNTWYYSREWFCLIVFQQLINTIDTRTGKVIGEAMYTINHAAGFDPRNPVWENFTSFYLDWSWGDAANLVASASSCTGCTGDSYDDVIPPWRQAPLDVAITGWNNLNDHPGLNGIHYIRVRWLDSFTCPNCVNPASLSWEFPYDIRCDGQENTGAAEGCAIPAFWPELQLTGYSSGNSSTAFVSFIQSRNVDHWGRYPSGRPLHRLNNTPQANANRAAMCSGFVAVPVVPSDSCDEFPFARTYESGNMLGQTASQCSQVIPQYAAGTWTFATYPGYSTSQRCGIGHVQLSHNQAVGGMYSQFIQNNRVIDNDPFWVGIYN